MNLNETAVGIIIHLIVPLIGLGLYIKLLHSMKEKEIEQPPSKELFILFATYGGLLLIILTTLFWAWSGMASLGFFYLLLGAPIVMGIIATSLHIKKELSKYHYWAYKATIWYFAIGPLTLITIFLIATYFEK